jgi:hypothetical protein
MQHRFFIEAKAFTFSVEAGRSELQLEERRSGYAGVIFLVARCVAWLIKRIEEVLRNPGAEEFGSTTWEASFIFIVNREGNSASRFWRWQSKVTGAGERLFCYRRVVKGRDGVDFLGS